MFHDIAGHEDLTDGIIACGIRVHEALGPGLLESVYRQSLEIELRESGFTRETTRKVHLVYRDRTLDTFFWPDLIVNGLVIVELKAIERIAAVSRGTACNVLEADRPSRWIANEFQRCVVEKWHEKSGAARPICKTVRASVLPFSRSPVCS